jgi:Zn finger protein HypA/HybF involved in hydrogenase expression
MDEEVGYIKIICTECLGMQELLGRTFYSCPTCHGKGTQILPVFKTREVAEKFRIKLPQRKGLIFPG